MNGPLREFSALGFSLTGLVGIGFCGSETDFAELVLARFFLNDRIGGQPTTGAGADLFWEALGTVVFAEGGEIAFSSAFCKSTILVQQDCNDSLVTAGRPLGLVWY